MIKNNDFILFLLIIFLFFVPISVCAQDHEDADTAVTEVDEETMKSWPFSDDSDPDEEGYISALDEEGRITFEDAKGNVAFISGDPYGALIDDESEAYDYALRFINEDDFELKPVRVDTYNDLVIYSYQQIHEDMLLDDCYLKIITNESGEVLGITSSLIQEIDEADPDQNDDAEDFDLRDRFADWESDMYETMVTTRKSPDGVDISVPIIIDPETGTRYLADLDRQLICIDNKQFDLVSDRREMFPIDLDNELVSESQLVTYSIFVQIYDYFDEKGWPGPDGRGNPCMLQFDTSGESNGNASYAKFQQGFHIFNFGVEDSASQSMQVLAHEYFHGVSSTNHIGDYENETGALDEALSDIVGNAVETDIEGRSMDQNVWIQTFPNLHTYQNPLYIWDEFYTPPTDEPEYENDQGSVHSNSTVISILAWRMYDAGMSASEVFNFWFTFDLVMTPNTDFAGTAARIPWIAEISGLSEYAPPLAQAVSDLHLGESALPDILPEHQGLLLVEPPADGSSVLAKITDPDNDIEFQTWPIRETGTIAAVMAEGHYIVSVTSGEEDSTVVYLWNGIDWTESNEDELDRIMVESYSDYLIFVGNGEVNVLN